MTDDAAADGLVAEQSDSVAATPGRLLSSRWAAAAAIVIAALSASSIAATRERVFSPTGQVRVLDSEYEPIANPAISMMAAGTTAVVRGTVYNAGTTTSGDIRVVVVLKDSGQSELRRVVGFAPHWRLGGQERAPFEAPFFSDPRMASYEVFVEESRRD